MTLHRGERKAGDVGVLDARLDVDLACQPTESRPEYDRDVGCTREPRTHDLRRGVDRLQPMQMCGFGMRGERHFVHSWPACCTTRGSAGTEAVGVVTGGRAP